MTIIASLKVLGSVVISKPCPSLEIEALVAEEGIRPDPQQKLKATQGSLRSSVLIILGARLAGCRLTSITLVGILAIVIDEHDPWVRLHSPMRRHANEAQSSAVVYGEIDLVEIVPFCASGSSISRSAANQRCRWNHTLFDRNFQPAINCTPRGRGYDVEKGPPGMPQNN